MTMHNPARRIRPGVVPARAAAHAVHAVPPGAAAAVEPVETGVAALRAILHELEDISASLHDLLED